MCHCNDKSYFTPGGRKVLKKKLKKVRPLPDYLLILFGLWGVPAPGLVGYFVYTANAKQKEKLNSTGWYWNQKISCNRILLLNIRTGYYLFFLEHSRNPFVVFNFT